MEKQKDQKSKLHKDLDKFYTKDEVAFSCFKALKEFLVSLDRYFFLEPSAGNGAFLRAIEKENEINQNKINIFGFDLYPENGNIIKNDFIKNKDLMSLLGDTSLLGDVLSIKNIDKKEPIVIGNPPFGTKAKLAIDFINNGLSISNVVGFVLPIQFRKWSAQSKIDRSASLVLDIDLPENAFLFMNKDYNVRCCFQIWVKDIELLKQYRREDLTGNNINIEEIEDVRLKNKPETTHKDFLLYQYNRTEEAAKYFDYEWDFAVPRQGYMDYTFKAFKKEDCNKKWQWIFFKANDKKILDKLLKLDFVKLSKKNIGIPGFGKADVIEEYNKVEL